MNFQIYITLIAPTNPEYFSDQKHISRSKTRSTQLFYSFGNCSVKKLLEIMSPTSDLFVLVVRMTKANWHEKPSLHFCADKCLVSRRFTSESLKESTTTHCGRYDLFRNTVINVRCPSPFRIWLWELTYTPIPKRKHTYTTEKETTQLGTWGMSVCILLLLV